jgi:hypothetical protein
MVWAKLEADRTEVREAHKACRSLRFYADEDVDEVIVGVVRGQRYDVESASERGHVGHSAEFHFKRSAAIERVLLTQDHDYLDESRFPLSQTWGVCVVDVDRANVGQLARALEVIDATLGAYGLLWKKSKLVIESDCAFRVCRRGGEGEFQYIDVSHYKFDANDKDVWVWKDP